MDAGRHEGVLGDMRKITEVIRSSCFWFLESSLGCLGRGWGGDDEKRREGKGREGKGYRGLGGLTEYLNPWGVHLGVMSG